MPRCASRIRAHNAYVYMPLCRPHLCGNRDCVHWTTQGHGAVSMSPLKTAISERGIQAACRRCRLCAANSTCPLDSNRESSQGGQRGRHTANTTIPAPCLIPQPYHPCTDQPVPLVARLGSTNTIVATGLHRLRVEPGAAQQQRTACTACTAATHHTMTACTSTTTLRPTMAAPGIWRSS